MNLDFGVFSVLKESLLSRYYAYKRLPIKKRLERIANDLIAKYKRVINNDFFVLFYINSVKKPFRIEQAAFCWRAFYGIKIPDTLMNWADGRAMILDGEMVITDAAGRTDFQALQNYMKNSQAQNLTYIVFDLLALDGEDFRGHRLIDRKKTLEALMKDAPKNLYYSRHVRGKVKESFRAACEAGLEGIIGKKADYVYSQTRNSNWIKLKCDKRQEFVIGGYTLSGQKTSGISSLLLGVYEDGEFIYAGRAGTGLSEIGIKELEKKFAGIKRMEPPFQLAPKPRSNEKITWLEPQLIAEIKFAEWTKENLLRQASFKGLRTDKKPRDIKRETERLMKANVNSIMIEGIKITNPDKVIFEDPEINKGDVIRYYVKVAGRMLPYVSHRILSIVRCPKGISETCFYKKHPGPGSKGVVTIPISTSDGETDDYFYVAYDNGEINVQKDG